MTPKERRKGPRMPQQEAYTLKDLDQIKVLADPLRIRMLEAFCQERTTKQVADLLGEKPTKLYHHVDALERVGLIALSRTRQNRGAVEKYYLAVARTFRLDRMRTLSGPTRYSVTKCIETLSAFLPSISSVKLPRAEFPLQSFGTTFATYKGHKRIKIGGSRDG